MNAAPREPAPGAIVLCTGGGIGDVLLATPVMGALRRRYGRVVAVTTPAHLAVLAADPDLDEVWPLAPGLLAFAALAGRIHGARFEVAVVTWATLGSALLPWLGGVPLRVGQARRSYSGLFTRRVVVKSERGDRTTHWTQILLDFARAAGCEGSPQPVFVPSEAARLEARAARAAAAPGSEPGAPYAVLHPTRGIAGARARWPAEALGALAGRLGRHLGVPVFVTGAEADRAIAERVAASGGATSLAGRLSLGAFGALAEGARVVVALDSGPMHIAAAVGAPTLGIFALQSDEPDRWAPIGPRTAVLRATYPCPPAHRKETCPDFACLRELDVGRVLAAVDGLLGG